MAASSRPSVRAVCTHRSRVRASLAWVLGGGPEGRAMAKVATFDETQDFQLPVGLQDRVRVDRDCGDDLFRRGKLVTGSKEAHTKRLFDLLHQLEIRGNSRGRVQLKSDRLPSEFTSHLEKYLTQTPAGTSRFDRVVSRQRQ